MKNSEMMGMILGKAGVMKKTVCAIIIISCLCLAFPSPGAAYAEDARYHYDRMIVTLAFDYTIPLSASDKISWAGEIAGNSNLLHIMYSAADLYLNGDPEPKNHVDIINISGANGERTFLRNGMTFDQYKQVIRQQFWSGITMDGTDVVKDYSKPLEIAYIEFSFLADNSIASISTIFSTSPKQIANDGYGVQICSTKTTDFRTVNYTGDISLITKEWEINREKPLLTEADKPPINEYPVDEASVHEYPVNEAPVHEYPVDKAPVYDEIPVIEERIEIADKLHDLNLFAGTNDGYELESTLTRAQAATVLVRLLGEEAHVLQADYPDNPFSDVPDNYWAKNYILYCYSNGITKGTGATTYSPDRTISAQEFLALLMRTMGYESAPETSLEDGIAATLFGSTYADNLQNIPQFCRNDVVDIMDKALVTPLNADAVLLAEELVKKNVFSYKQAVEAQLLPNSEEGALEQLIYLTNSKLN